MDVFTIGMEKSDWIGSWRRYERVRIGMKKLVWTCEGWSRDGMK